MFKKRIIKCQVNDEYVVGSGVPIGAAGSHDDIVLQLEFNEMWAGLYVYATFRDALGGHPTVVLLLPSMLVAGTDMTYEVTVPAAAKLYAGKATFTLTGYTTKQMTEGDVARTVEGSATNTATAYFPVLPSDYTFAEDGSITPNIAQQLQGGINDLGDRVTDAELDISDLKTGLAETKEEILEDIEGFLGEKTIFATKAGLKDTVAINGEVRYPSEGLEYVLNDDGTEAAVVGIGTCTDINVVVPRTYNGVPVKAVLNNAFENASIDSINLFEGVTYIGAEAFKGSPVRFIYMYSPAPFEIGADAFPDTVKGLFVPLHSVDAYKANKYWSAYADRIVAIETPESINTFIVQIHDILMHHIVNLSNNDAALQQAVENLSAADRYLLSLIDNSWNYVLNTLTPKVEAIEACSEGLSFYAYTTDGFYVNGWGDCKDKDIVIPSTYNGYRVIGIDKGAFANNSFADSVTVPETVTEIREQAFASGTFKNVTILSKTPPSLSGAIGSHFNADTVIYVPSAMVKTYQLTTGWESYASRIKPIQTLDTTRTLLTEEFNGLKSQMDEINEKLGTAGVISFIPVVELPTENIVENAIYLVPSENGAEPNLFDEYVYIDGTWEKIGSANVSVDMTGYVKKDTSSGLLRVYGIGGDGEQTTYPIISGASNVQDGRIPRYRTNTANEIMANDNCVLPTGTPLLGHHAANKEYVDNNFVAIQEKPMENWAGVYGINTDGTQTVFMAGVGQASNKVAITDAYGCLLVADPKVFNHAASKQYVDNLFNSIVNGEEVAY